MSFKISKSSIQKWRDKGRVRKLFKALESNDSYITELATETLTELGSSSVGPLLEFLKSSKIVDLNTRERAKNSLASIGEAAVIPIVNEFSNLNTFSPININYVGGDPIPNLHKFRQQS